MSVFWGENTHFYLGSKIFHSRNLLLASYRDCCCFISFFCHLSSLLCPLIERMSLCKQQNKLDVVVFLLGVKADIYCKNSNSDTPLSIAQANHDQCLVRILKREGSRSSNDITKTLLEGNDISRACSSSHKSVTSLQIAGCASFAVMQSCPAPIARALLSNHAIEPLSRSMASLFFSDIVGFTEISSKLTASKVSTLLHALAKVIHSRSTLSVLPPTPAERSTSPRCRPLTALPTSTGSRRWTLSATPT